MEWPVLLWVTLIQTLMFTTAVGALVQPTADARWRQLEGKACMCVF